MTLQRPVVRALHFCGARWTKLLRLAPGRRVWIAPPPPSNDNGWTTIDRYREMVGWHRG